MPPRVRVVDAEQIAREMREVFAARPVEYMVELDFDWPSTLQNIGDSLAVAYASDKWKDLDAKGKRDIELYKHLAESRNRVLVKRGLLVDADDTDAAWPVIGPHVALAELPMPKHFAVIGLFEEACLKLYTSNGSGYHFSKAKDDGIVRVQLRHAFLGGSKILWSSNDPHDPGNEPFLFVYTEEDGILMVIVGDELDVQKDGIVG